MALPDVASISPHLKTLEAPSELRKVPSWLIWRYEREPGAPADKPPLKVPYYISGQKRYGRQGTPTDRAKLVTFAAAKDAAARRGFDGVGLALLPNQGIVALDFDHVVGPDGALPSEVLDIISTTYAEFSPSGTGVRAFVRGDLGNHKSRSAPDQPWGAETFSSTGFCTFTGQPYWTTETFGNEETIGPITPALERLVEARFGALRGPNGSEGSDDPLETLTPVLGLPEVEIAFLLGELDPSMGRDGWIRVGMAVHHETEGEGFALWDEWSSAGTQYPGSEALETQWVSFSRPSNRIPVTMASVKKMVEEVCAANSEQRIEAVAVTLKADLESIEPSTQVATPDGYRGRFPIHSALAFAQRPEPEWIIKGVLPKADLGVIYGQSGSGKSLITLDMVLAVARGIEWRGRKVKQGRVLYLVAEGGGGVPTRLKAYAQHHGVKFDDIPLGVMHGVPNLLVEDDVTEIMAALVKAGGVDLIVIDTLAQVTGGANENSAEDMGLALKHARSIRDMTDAMVLLVHHSGKDIARGARGWSGIRAAADVELEVLRDEEQPVRTLRLSKQKDGRDDLSWGFTLEERVVGIDRDGEEVTSVVCVEAEIPVPVAEEVAVKPVGTWQQIVIDAVNGMLEPTASLETVLKLAMDRSPQPGPEERDVRKQNLRRALQTLTRGVDPTLELANGMVTVLRYE